MSITQAGRAFSDVMANYDGFWCVAGGCAIDLHLGRQTREHEDLEVVVLREEAPLLYGHLRERNPQKIFGGDSPTFVPWRGEQIEPEVIQLRIDPIDGMDFDLLLTPSRGEQWICRRDERMQRALAEIRGYSVSVPYLSPEIVLLFKAKYVRSKDQSDFAEIIRVMAPSARSWLLEGLRTIHPGHEWITRLESRA